MKIIFIPDRYVLITHKNIDHRFTLFDIWPIEVGFKLMQLIRINDLVSGIFLFSFILSIGLRQSEATYKCLLCTVFLSRSVTRLHDVTNATMGNSSK